MNIERYLTTKMKLCLLLAVAVGLMYRTDGLAFNPATHTVSISEDAAVGTSVYQTVIANSETADSYDMTGDNGKFEITTTGLVKVLAELDHESADSYTLSITASADGDETNTQLELTVTVTNVVAPTSVDPVTGSILDTCLAGSLVETFKATVPGDSAVVYSIASADPQNDFTINGASGELRVACGKTLDEGTTTTYNIVLHAADTASPAMTATTTVTITVTAGDDTTSCETDDNFCNNAAVTLVAPILIMACWLVSYSLK